MIYALEVNNIDHVNGRLRSCNQTVYCWMMISGDGGRQRLTVTPGRQRMHAPAIPISQDPGHSRRAMMPHRTNCLADRAKFLALRRSLVQE